LKTRRIKADLSKGSNAISAGVVSVNSFQNQLFSQQRTGFDFVFFLPLFFKKQNQIKQNLIFRID